MPGSSYSRADLVSTDPGVLYEEGSQPYQNFAINSNVCMCEDFLQGTNRGKKFRKRCKKCGFDRPGFDQEDLTVVRRSVSEESINNALYNDYLRRKRMINQKPVFYDEQDEYEDIDFIARPMRSSSSRKIKAKSSRSRSPGRRSSSPVHKKSARTQSMIVNNRNQLNITKDNKEMQNITGAIRASPLRSASSVTGGFKPKMSGEQNRNVVTVNGSHSASKNNSSVIYLSPDAAVLPSTDSVNTTITITTSTPASLFNQGAIRVSPFDLIKKYIQDSPNSLSDSNLSSDDQQQKSDNKSCEEESECDYGYSDEDPVNDSSGCHFVPSVGSTVSNGFKISGQKIQIYSDGSIAATDTVRAYSLSESEEESDKESEYSNYDADCSVMESPRIAIKVSDETPVKPPRRRSAEKDAARIAEDIERLQLQDQSKYKSSPNPDDTRTFPRSSTGRTERVPADTRNSDSSSGVRKSSVDSSHSGPSRSKSFNGSRESLNLFGSVDFKNLSISKNFSSDVIREVYGSKTSLLKHLDQQREERKLRQSEFDGGEEENPGRTREMLVQSLLCKSTDSILTSSRKSGDKSVSGFQRSGKFDLTN